MKKTLIVLFTAVLSISMLFVSCSNEAKFDETVQIGFSSASVRGLTASQDIPVANDLFWFYKAAKTPGSAGVEINYGAKSDWTPVKDGVKGLTPDESNGRITLAQGRWDFELQGRKDAEKESTAVYQGSTSNVLIIKDGTKVNSITVPVSQLATGTGTVKLSDISVKINDVNISKNYKPTSYKYRASGSTEWNLVGNADFSRDIEIPLTAATYDFVVMYNMVDDGNNIVYASAPITITVTANVTTTITGSLDVETTMGHFGVTVVGTKATASSDTVSENKFTVPVTPSAIQGKNTTVSFGSYNVGTSSTTGDDGNTTEVSHSLEVSVSSSDTVDTTDEERFIVDSGRDAVAALDLTLIKTTKVTDAEGNATTTTEPVTTFGEGNKVTITTFIEKNLFDVKVRYNNRTDTPEEITPERYTPATGELVFKVSHFSEYYVVAKLPEARIGSVYYKTFDDAWNAATEGSIIEIENDVVFDSSFKMNKKNITINGNGYRFVASDSYYYTKKPAYNMCLANTSGSEGLVFNNIVFDGNNKTYSLIGSGKDKTFNNCVFKNSLNGHYYGVSNGYLKFKDCEFYCNMYNVNQSEGGCVVSFEDCILSGWNSFADSETVSFTRTTFTKVPENWYSIVRTYSSTTFTDCSFTEEFVEHEDNTYGCGINPVQKSVAELNDCVVIDSEGNISARYSLSDACKPFVGKEDLLDMGLCIIDGQKNGEKYCSGTIVGDNRLIGEVIAEDAYASVNDNGTYTVSSLTVDEDGTYLINDANYLVLFEKLVNERGNTFSGKTVKLTDDIDLSGINWIPVGQTGATEFKGVFDGQGYTIRNMTVNNTDTSASCSSGFFGWIEDHGEGIVIKDTKFNNAHVEGNHNVGVVAGYIYGTINGCEVSNSTIIAHNANNDANGDKVGGIAGFVGEDAFIDNNRLLIAK